MVMSVVPKWESRAWMNVSARNKAATSAVASSHSVRASRYTTNTVPTPAVAERPAADQKERLPVDRPARDEIGETLERPRHDSPRVIDEVQAGQHPHVQPGVVVEGRLEVAPQEVQRDVDDLRLVGACLRVRKPERDSPESNGGREGQNARQQDSTLTSTACRAGLSTLTP